MVFFPMVLRSSTLRPLSELSFVNQLIIAGLKGMIGTTPDLSSVGFSGPVMHAVSLSVSPTPADTTGAPPMTAPCNGVGCTPPSLTGTPRMTIDDVALSLNAFNFLTIAYKIYALSSTPSMRTILEAYSRINQQTLDNFFNVLSQSSSSSSLVKVLDVRTISTLPKLLNEAGLPDDPRIINLALMVDLSLVFNKAFNEHLEKSFSSLSSVINTQLRDLNNVLINMASMIDPTDIITMTRETNEKVHQINIMSLTKATSFINPTVNQAAAGQAFLNQLSPSSSEVYQVPTSSLQKASNLYQLLNSVNF